jgi:hypothetical protein
VLDKVFRNSRRLIYKLLTLNLRPTMATQPHRHHKLILSSFSHVIALYAALLNALSPPHGKKPECNNNCMSHITQLRAIIVNKIVYVPPSPACQHLSIRLRLSFQFPSLLSCVKFLEIVIVVSLSLFSVVIAMCCEWEQNLG